MKKKSYKKYPKNLDTLNTIDQLTIARHETIHQVAQQRQRGLTVIMEDVRNPYNLAAIARNCDAFGIQTIMATLENEDLFDPKEVGNITSASASKWMDYRIFHGTAHGLHTLKTEGWTLIASALTPTAHSIYDVDFTPYEQIALLVGNETAGLSDLALSYADLAIMIPMRGMIHSFNVSVATALILYEITRQRQLSGKDYQLSAEEVAQIQARWRTL